MSSKHRWSYEDDYICCQEYLKFVFDYIGDDSLIELVEIISRKLPHIEQGSIRMKIQNIKKIALEEGLEDRLTFSPLSNYSVQCKRAFYDAVDEREQQM